MKMTTPKWKESLDDNCEPLSKGDKTNLLYIQASKNCDKEKKEIEKLQQLLNTCNGNFTTPPPVPVVEGFADLQQQQISPYDIRKHKQYKQLIDSIKSEYVLTKRKSAAEVAAAAAGPKCVPYATTDIRKHKDYPKMSQYIYEMATKKCSDIKSNPDFAKVVRAVQRKTMMEYGQQTASGQYIKCPPKNNNNNSNSIQQHPQYAQLVQSIVKKTIREYGEPIPGSSPVEFRRCSPLSTKCVQKFALPAQENFVGNHNEHDLDPFDIRNHTQYRQMLTHMEQNCNQNLSNYVLKSSLPASCLAKEEEEQKKEKKENKKEKKETKAAIKEGFADLKETTAKMLQMKVLDPSATKVVKDIHNDLVAVENGQKKVSALQQPAAAATVPVMVSDVQQMLQSNVEMAKNQKELEKTQQHIEAILQQQKQKQKQKDTQKQTPNNNDHTYILQNQLEGAKARMDHLTFKNARLREELNTLRRMCNERIVNLWNEGHGLRKGQDAVQQKKKALENKERRLEALDARVAAQEHTQQDKFLYYTNQAQMYNSVAKRYKKELDGLRRNLQSQNVLLSRSQGECAQRVERYRQMYERTVVLLDELRVKGAHTPVVMDHIDHLKNTLTQNVNQAVTNVSKPATDAHLIAQMTQMGDKMSSIEDNIQASGDDMMWLKNQYASV